MRKAFVIVAVAIFFSACTKTSVTRQGPTPAPETTAGQAHGAPGADNSTGVPPGRGTVTAEDITYLPSQERALTRGDPPTDGVTWKQVGMSFPLAAGDLRYGLTLTEAPLLDQDHLPTGPLIPARSRLRLLETGGWERTDDGYRSYDRVRYDAGTGPVEGWVDASMVALMVADADGIAAGVVPARIFISGGDADYNLLAIQDDRGVTLVDTSYFAFPNEFHPSGVLRVSIADMNGDGLPELVVEGETIVSFRYLGTSPLRWVAWLRPRQGSWGPILFYNESFGSDEGYSYTAEERAFATTGAGMSDMVRVNTDYLLTSGQEEFRANLVSFYVWNGEAYRKAPLQDLPKAGVVAVAGSALLQDPDPSSAVVETLEKGDPLFVVDRGDLRRPSEDQEPWWYRAITKSGAEGWISGADLTLSWLDPMKQNREAFLGQAAGTP